MIKLWYTYCLIPGSALILLLFLNPILSLMTICIDYAELAVGQTQPLESGTGEAVIEILVFLELIIHVTFLGYGVVIKGMRPLLIAWMIAEGIFMLIWEIQLIWFLVETLTYLSHADKSMKIIMVLMYFIVYTAVYYSYEINLAMQCLPAISNTSGELDPIGKGVQYIIDYYKTHAKDAACLALMSEIMLNVHVFLERHVTQYGIGFDYIDDEVNRSWALYLEETVVRYSRVIICVLGFYLAFKEKTVWMFRWCIAYLVALTMSFAIFLYMVFLWRAVHGLLTLIYFTTFTLNLLFRTGVLYTCVRISDNFQRQGLPL